MKTEFARAYDRVTMPLLRTTVQPWNAGEPQSSLSNDPFGATPRFGAPGITTDGFVWIGKGLSQGDPASPILFDVVLEEVWKPLLEIWSAHGNGVLVGCLCLLVLAFADDVCMFGSDLDQTRTMLREMYRYLQANGLATVSTSDPECLDVDCHHVPRVQEMSVLGRRVSLHNRVQVAAQRRMRKSWGGVCS